MIRRINIKRSGFSLLEVVFAFAILELGLLALIGTFPAIMSMNRNAWQMTVATQLATEKMEEILSKGYFITATKDAPAWDEPKSLSNCVRFWWAEDDPNGDPNVRLIKVKVQWNERKRVRTITIGSLMHL